jgi:hypothetical protein
VTVATSIAVYVLMCFFSTVADDAIGTEDREETERLLRLQYISYIVLLLGALMGLAFIVLVPEKKTNGALKKTAVASSENLDASPESKKNAMASRGSTKTVYDWFATPGFFGVTATYAFARLCINIIQLYLPFYVLYAMPECPSALATVPLMAYVGMIISSMAAPKVSLVCTDAAWVCTGATIVLSMGSALLLYLAEPQREVGMVFLASGILGFGCAQLMVASQTQVGELVGSDSNGGVVFGICSLCDKFSTGMVIFWIQRLVQLLSAEAESATTLGDIYRFTAAGGPAMCAALACLSLLTVPMHIRDRGFQSCPAPPVLRSPGRSEV